VIRRALVFLGALSAGLVLFGFMGAVHRSADSIALLRPVAGVGCFLGLVAASRIWRLAYGLIAALAVLSVAATLVPQRPGGDIRIYSKNLWGSNTQMRAVADDVLAAGVDVVMLQEISNRNRVILRHLQDRFPHQHLCRFSRWNGIAVLSRFPFDGAQLCSETRAVAAARLVVGAQRVWAVSAHIPWPWPQNTSGNERAAMAVFARLEGAVIVAGDFNIAPWSGRVTRIALATRTRLAGPVWPTFTFRRLPLPIDMAMAPGGGEMETRPTLGSDHAGIVADLSLTPS